MGMETMMLFSARAAIISSLEETVTISWWALSSITLPMRRSRELPGIIEPPLMAPIVWTARQVMIEWAVAEERAVRLQPSPAFD
ncbi:MAG: hypothetical protein P0119_11920 [Nitrospira sp.]|nr:hypothetical protein [Nitrospira sp.]